MKNTENKKTANNNKYALWIAIGVGIGAALGSANGSDKSDMGLWIGLGAAFGSALYCIAKKADLSSK